MQSKEFGQSLFNYLDGKAAMNVADSNEGPQPNEVVDLVFYVTDCQIRTALITKRRKWRAYHQPLWHTILDKTPIDSIRHIRVRHG